MRLLGSAVNYTPVFVLPARERGYWGRAFGGVQRPGDWVYPGYYPFGRWALADLRKIDPTLALDPAASDLARELDRSHELLVRAEADWAAGRRVELPRGLDDFCLEPYNHQRLGVARLLASRRNFLLWEMGTGKTKTVVDGVRLLRRENRFRRLLVLGPTVVLPTWEREVDKSARGELAVLLWDGAGDDLPERAARADVVVATYARARIERERGLKAGRPSRLLDLDYDAIAADESHALGDPASAQTQAVLELSAKAVTRVLLTGTPADRPDKLYAQLRFLSPALMPIGWQEFRDRHLVYSKEEGRRHLVVGYKFMAELNATVDRVASRMRKRDCLDLPPMVVTDVPFALGPRQRARYNELVLEMRASATPDAAFAVRFATDAAGRVAPEDVPAPSAPELFSVPHGAARVTKLLQVVSGFVMNGPDASVCDACPRMPACAEARIRPYTRACAVVQRPPPTEVVRDVENPKLELFEDLLANILGGDPTNKVLCWGTFLPELDDMVAACRRLGVGHVRVDGSNTNRMREWEDAFQLDPACRVYVGQVSSGVGVTLTAANYAIYYSLPWDSVKYRQSLERNNRPGQTRKMTAYRLLADDTLDGFVARTLEFKDHVAYTLVEKVACATCTEAHRARCAREQNHPFRRGCVYQDGVSRPVAPVRVVNPGGGGE